MSKVEQKLRDVLYRFNCPSKMDLGEYELGLLDLYRHKEISSHLNSCPHCASDLEKFAEFMSMPLVEAAPSSSQTTKKRSLLDEMWVVVVDLLSPPAGVEMPPLLQPAMRGESDKTSTRVLHIEPYVISLSVIREGSLMIEQHIIGDIYPVAVDDIHLRNWTANLWNDGNLVATSSVDDDNHFLLEDIPVANDLNDLVLSGPQVEIHLQNLRMV